MTGTKQLLDAKLQQDELEQFIQLSKHMWGWISNNWDGV